MTSEKPRWANRVVGHRLIVARELRSRPDRWRRHPATQRRVLTELLTDLGFADALVVRETPDGLELLDGELRADLAGDQPLPVVVVDLDDDEARRFLLTHDPVGAMATAADEAMQKLMAEVDIPRDLSDDITRRYSRPRVAKDMEAPPPSEVRPPRVAPGEIWALGEHRLACGDARDHRLLEAIADGEQIEMMWTDPPYGVSYVGKTARALTINGDEATGLEALLSDAFEGADRVLAPGARIYVCHPAGPQATRFAQAFEHVGWRHRSTLIWVKDRMVLGRGDYHYRHEPILFGYKVGRGRWGRGGQGWYGGDGADSVFEIPRLTASVDHPTMKPIELIEACLTNSSLPAHAVLDPFVGSGSTILACERLGRRAFAVEVDPVYCEVAVTRWEQMTGAEARRLSPAAA